jgi:hypothetical protein
MTREKMLDRDEAVLRAKVTLTKEQLTELIHTLNDATWGKNGDGLPNGTMALWLPLDQVGIDYVVVNADGHPPIAPEHANHYVVVP